MCNKHYLRWWNATKDTDRPASDPSLSARYRPDNEKLMDLVENLPNGCWKYLGHINGGGYGQIKRQGRSTNAHRVYYERLLGPIPGNKPLDHLCHTRDASCSGGRTCPHRRCVNPEHLEPVSVQENNQRSLSPSGSNKRKTHCKNGHPLSGPNLFINAAGERQCHVCTTERNRLWAQRNTAKRRASLQRYREANREKLAAAARARRAAKKNPI